MTVKGMKMKQKSQTRQTGAAKAIKDIRRATRKQYSAEEKIRIVLDGFRGEETISERNPDRQCVLGAGASTDEPLVFGHV